LRLVAGVLAAAAGRLRDRGQELWSVAEVSEERIAAHVEQGRYYVGADAAGTVGVFRIDEEDPLFWPEMPAASAFYVHKVAVDPRRQGQGAAQRLLACACDIARANGRRVLRLDCAGGRPKLRAVYERFGFRHHSDKILAGRVFHRFELDLDAPELPSHP
jgi:GNAT superfamily N-acetyltransferase